MEVKRIIEEEEFQKLLESLTTKIIKANRDINRVILIGIKRRGTPLAKRVALQMRDRGKDVLVGSIDINLYRDDLTTIDKKPMVYGTDIPFDIDDEVVILVDDVLYTGRTLRAALTEFADLGRPKNIEYACLIDRGHRELPVCANFIGKFLETEQDEMVEVRVKELDGEDCVMIVPHKHGKNN